MVAQISQHPRFTTRAMRESARPSARMLTYLAAAEAMAMLEGYVEAHEEGGEADAFREYVAECRRFISERLYDEEAY